MQSTVSNNHMCRIVTSMYDECLVLTLTTEEQEFKIRPPITPTAKRLWEFQLRFLAFGMRKMVTTIITQLIRYHLTIPTSRIMKGSTVNWRIPKRIPTVSASFLGPHSQWPTGRTADGIEHEGGIIVQRTANCENYCR